MMRMVAFRNIAIHQYTKLDMQIVVSIIEKDLGFFRQFVKIALILT